VNDVVAEVFLVAWRRIDEAPESREMLWLYGIAKNVIRNAHRARHRQERLRTKVTAQGLTSEPSAEVHVVRNVEERAVLDPLATLRPVGVLRTLRLAHVDEFRDAAGN
jgi:DNA-directed RNA polymerase specialized sigma24 family protein